MNRTNPYLGIDTKMDVAAHTRQLAEDMLAERRAFLASGAPLTDGPIDRELRRQIANLEHQIAAMGGR
jgi:hypothetical protein